MYVIIAVCCSVLQCLAVLPCVAVCSRVVQRVAVCCSFVTSIQIVVLRGCQKLPLNPIYVGINV